MPHRSQIEKKEYQRMWTANRRAIAKGSPPPYPEILKNYQEPEPEPVQEVIKPSPIRAADEPIPIPEPKEKPAYYQPEPVQEKPPVISIEQLKDDIQERYGKAIPEPVALQPMMIPDTEDRYKEDKTYIFVKTGLGRVRSTDALAGILDHNFNKDEGSTWIKLEFSNGSEPIIICRDNEAANGKSVPAYSKLILSDNWNQEPWTKGDIINFIENLKRNM